MDPLIYQYAVGGVVFVGGLLLASRRGGWGIPRGWLILLLSGFGAFLALQATLQYTDWAARPSAATHAADAAPVRLTRLDVAIVVAYFVVILAIGTTAGRRQSSLGDFLHGGQRFSAGLIAFSLMASLVGSYSFVKYSRIAFEYGLPSTQTYLNDWFWMPLLLFGWLPILYFTRTLSIPEYFHKRFGGAVRHTATALILVYLIGYIGVNLFTMGKAMNGLLGWDILSAAAVAAMVSAIYVTFGGQTSVIMTDLFQGVMLLVSGLVILGLGVHALGGWEMLWTSLPPDQRRAFPAFNASPSFSGVGIFWQDAIANSAMFYFVNQGILMRFMAARSLRAARQAAVALPLILMPAAAVVVACGGWIARALVERGQLPADVAADRAFFVAVHVLCTPGVFGLVLATLTAALMSTVDTLVTAVAAIVVNDVIRPWAGPDVGEARLLLAARTTAVVVTLCGLALVRVFSQFESIFAAHAAFTAAVTPPLVVCLLLSVFWPRFNRAGALATLIGGSAAIAATFLVPDLITPFAHGVPMGAAGDGWFGGFQQYKFMRALFGLVASGGCGLAVTWVTPADPRGPRGLLWNDVGAALHAYVGRSGTEHGSTTARARVTRLATSVAPDVAGRPGVTLTTDLAQQLGAAEGDLALVRDARWWLGGFRCWPVRIQTVVDGPDAVVAVPPRIARYLPSARPVIVERLY